MRRLALTLMAALVASAASAAPALNARYADPAQPDISGVWQVTGLPASNAFIRVA